ncbi:hypothetical protein [Hymenobacter cellulosilyticus]|uniref:Uncharacterized protein n=1 Tax=Hymenobacter cellulosilyticus TaxID=2932248 RepID=A0A8T9QB50_9BACT|nr:hypothetical protein [Hymenobacter cellulosilyticus]UOQ74786.1 hypothetical protein MUN79_13500 [Hymenobacter cellulosilyticus]
MAFAAQYTALIIMAVLCYGEFAVVQSLLPAPSVALWQRFGLALAGLGLSTLGYALFLIWRGRSVGPEFSILALATHLAFVVVYLNYDTQLLPQKCRAGWCPPTCCFMWALS